MWPFKRRARDAEKPFLRKPTDVSPNAEDIVAPPRSDRADRPSQPSGDSTLVRDASETPAVGILPRSSDTGARRASQAPAAPPDWVAIRSHLRDAFTSSQPVINREQLVGRHGELERLFQAVSEQQAHAIIYGPRGYGKTSLVRTFGEIADEAGYFVLYTSCSHFIDFADLFRPYLDEVPVQYSSRYPPSSSGAALVPLSSLLPREFNARQLADLLGSIQQARLIFILDEYDRIDDPSIQREVAELIKDLSDLKARVYLVLVGVARNLQELLGFHPSIHRNLLCVPIHRLDPESARQVITTGAAHCGLMFDDEAIDVILSLTYGSPYHLRLMCLHAGLVAVGRRQTSIGLPLLRDAIDHILFEWAPLDPAGAAAMRRINEDAEFGVSMQAVSRACLSHGDRCTIAQATDEYRKLCGICDDGGAIGRKLGSLCAALANSGQVLVKVSPQDASAKAAYAFLNHMTPQFLLMSAWRHGAGRSQESRP